MRYFAAMIMAVLLVGTTWAEVKIGETAPTFTLNDQNDKAVKLADFKDQIVVLEFTNFSCPFVKKHYNEGHMQALQKKYTDQSVVWLQVCASAPGKQGHFDAATIKEKIAERKSKAHHYLRDESGVVGKSYGAKTTPHFFIIGKDGKLAYQGAIDKIRSTKTADIEKPENVNYVAKALDELLAGQAVSTPQTKSYGCSVKY